MKPAPLALTALLILALATPAVLAQDSQPASPPAKNLPPAKEILEKALDAMGGKKAYQKIQSTHFKVSSEIPGMGSISFDISSAKGGKFLALIDQMGMSMTSGNDGQQGWMQNPQMGGYVLLDKIQAEEMQEQIKFLDGIFRLEKKFEKMQTVDQTDFNEEACYQVHMSSEKHDDEQDVFFSVKTGRIVGSTMTQEGPMGAMEISMGFEEWKKFGDLTLYTRINLNQMGMEMEMNIDKIEFNKVDPAIFKLPAEVEELIVAQEESASPPDDEKPTSQPE